MFDQKTSCMTQDLHVTINVDSIDCNVKSKSDSKKMDVRKVFRARLMDFMKGHPERDEIPEDALLEPFNCPKRNLHSNCNETSTASNISSLFERYAFESNQSSWHVFGRGDILCYFCKSATRCRSHRSWSFRRHFSQPLANKDAELTEAS
ncbi:CDT1-like protein a, chloroplastic isoform X2 [Mangifera indica]|nr:CDT1-like protein a, chloroplastic isoform X2 [Mangifera indica]